LDGGEGAGQRSWMEAAELGEGRMLEPKVWGHPYQFCLSLSFSGDYDLNWIFLAAKSISF